ncbi:hypothetical protein [Sphingomonas sp. UNC305MFCol5.2]|uniref:hypothetical protein n=1 Tax=Sphingomonas sp. UNC305MFCol5.2 TaxID=1449076 RepID=UPI000422B82C|nr:hypothetical protein [Sphingomonas sp. UNC305MFCol5.2]
MKHWKALAAALLVPLALAACLFLPGKFQSTLTIHADRSFTYAYKGEVVALDITGAMSEATSGLADNTTDGPPAPDPAKKAAEKAKKEAEYRDIAVKVAKEAGYRTVEYRGDGVFYVDYEITGKLTHNFVFPYNQDAGMIFPFVAIELRGKDMVRVKAAGFAKPENKDGGMSGMGEDTNARLDGVFTLVTDAEIVSQNNEDGAKASGASKSVTWKVTPTSSDAPMAMLKVAGL